MLGDSPLYADLPVQDIARSRQFYEGVLGATPVRIRDAEVLYSSGTTRFAIYQTDTAGKAAHTLATYIVDDLVATVEALRARGVTFEEYDYPDFKTTNGIATFGPDKVAWFRDPDGNILNLTQEDI